MMHKGEIVENAIRMSGHSITDIAKKLQISRRHLYNLFQKYNIENEIVIEIGKIINHDFSGEIKGLSVSMVEEPVEKYTTEIEKLRMEVDLWKNKYILLLEEHKTLMEKLKESDKK